MRCLWLLSLVFAVPAMAEDVTVLAAASLAGPLDEIAETFEADTGHDVTLVYAGSSALARQIGAGAPADLVILANESWMDHLAALGVVDPGSVRTLLTNRLVLIGSSQRTAPATFADMPEALGSGRLALALTEAVPAGIYARQALEAAGLWDDVAPQVVEADNVRAALMLVAIGAADLGIVYATDAVEEPRVTILADIPEDGHDPIRYPAALTPQANPAGRAFFDHLATPESGAAFSRAGFGVPSSD